MGALQKYLVLLALVSACYAVLCPPLLKVCALKKVALHSLLGTILQPNNTFLNQLLNKVSTAAPPSIIHFPRPLVPVALTPGTHTSVMVSSGPDSGLPATPAQGMMPAAPAPGMMPAAPAPGMMPAAPPAEMMAGAPPAETMAGAPPAETMAGAPPAEMMAGAPPAEMMAGAAPAEMMAGAAPAGMMAGAPPAEMKNPTP